MSPLIPYYIYPSTVKLFIIVGLPGSGASHILQEVRERDPTFPVIENASINQDLIIKTLISGRTVIARDYEFCRKGTFNDFVQSFKGRVPINVIRFRKNIESCKKKLRPECQYLVDIYDRHYSGDNYRQYNPLVISIIHNYEYLSMVVDAITN